MKGRYSICAFVIFLIGLFISTGYGNELEITVTTHSYEGKHAPINAAAIWILTPDDNYVSTMHIWSEDYGLELKNYIWYTTGLNNGIEDTLRANHDEPLVVKWDLIDYYGNLILDGDYVVWAELSEDSIYTEGEDYFGKVIFDTITIYKDSSAFIDTIEDTEYFTNFIISYTPTIIVPSEQKKDLNAGFICKYNPLSQHLTVTRGSTFQGHAFLRITNLKGEVIKKIPFDSREVRWNIRNNKGEAVSSGIYLLEIQSIDGIRLSPVHSFPLVR